MHKILLAAGVALALGAGGAHASTISDPVGDFLPSFLAAFPNGATPDLDVVGFTVDLDDAHSAFDITGTLAGPLDTTKSNLYVIGVDTGAGAIRPFAGIGEPNVIFDRAILVRENGTGVVGSHALSPTISGDSFSVTVPYAFLLPASGFASPHQYLFNLWPRNGLGNNNQISDFAPQNRLLAVPEPASWALMIMGVGFAGAAMRGRRTARA